jgi:SAM-dependent methyltransferase
MSATLGARVSLEHLAAGVCPVCHGSDVELLFARDGYEFLRCPSCDVVLYEGVEGVTHNEHLFPPEYFTQGGAGYPDYLADEEVHRRQARTYLRRLEHRGVPLAPGSHVFDVGCAAGFFLDEARRIGFEVSGCDVSATMVAHARDRLALRVAHGEFLDVPGPRTPVDLLTMFGVLEHLPSPQRVEARAFEMVRPGGYLAIETWNRRSLLARAMGAGWHVYAPPTTLFYHSEQSLRTLFHPERWELVAFRPAVKWISLHHGMAALERVSDVARRVVDLARHATSDGSAALAVPYALGDLVFVVFQRRATGAWALSSHHG